MSKALKANEKGAFSHIGDTEQIDNLINRILDMTLAEFDGGEERFQYLSGDIAKGMVLESKKIEKLTLRDVFTLIYHEPCFPWFEVPKDTSRLLRENPSIRLGSAGHSFFIARVINERRKVLPVLDRFCQINLHALYNYLICKKADPDIVPEWLYWQYFAAEKYIVDYTGPYEDYGQILESLTVGDLIKNACRIGSKSWIFGTLYLEEFVDDIYHSYDIMRILFMDSITKALIPLSKDAFRALLDSCSKSGTYDDELYAEIEFQNCYNE